MSQLSLETTSSVTSRVTIEPADSTQSRAKTEVICQGCWDVKDPEVVVISAGCFKILCRSCHDNDELHCCHQCTFYEINDADIPIEAKLDLMDANDKFRFLHNNIIEPLRQACEKEIVEIEQQRSDNAAGEELEIKKQASKLHKRSTTNKSLIEQYTGRANTRQAHLKEEMKTSGMSREDFEIAKEQVNSQTASQINTTNSSILDSSLNGSFRFSNEGTTASRSEISMGTSMNLTLSE